MIGNNRHILSLHCKKELISVKFRKVILTVLLVCFLLTLLPASAFAATLGANVTTVIPSFKVTMNGQLVDNTHREYPFLVYKDVTYFPMTYWDMRFLGVSNTWSAENGSVIVADGSTSEYKPSISGTKNKMKNVATVNSGAFKVNGKVIDNAKEKYPILSFKNVPYFPLTWDWCQEFGWDISFDATSGLAVNTKKVAVASDKENNEDYKNSVKTVSSEYLLDDWEIKVNGQQIASKVAYIDGTYLIPVEKICDALGLRYKYKVNQKEDYTDEMVTIIASYFLREGQEKNADYYDFFNIRLNNGDYYAWMDVLPSGNEGSTHETIANGRYAIDSSYLDPYSWVQLKVLPVKINNTIYIDARAICYSVGAPLEIKNNTITIGKCFTATYNSSEKIMSVLKKIPKDGYWLEDVKKAELQDISEYMYLAGNDFRSIRRDYPSAVAQNGYVHAYKDSNGDVCVLTIVEYKILTDWKQVTLHNMKTGETIINPEGYYDMIIDRAYGKDKLNLMEYKTELLTHIADMYRAKVNIMTTGKNTLTNGAYVDAATLNA